MTEYAMRYAVPVLAALFIGGCSSRTGVEFSARDHFELNNTYQDVLSVTVSVPAAGYVVLTGSGYTKMIRRGGTSWVTLSVGPNSGRSNNENETAVEFPASVGSSAEFTIPFSLTTVLPVESGDRNFYLVGIKDPNPGSASINASKLTAVFIERRL
jgi:hypothetical protein